MAITTGTSGLKPLNYRFNAGDTAIQNVTNANGGVVPQNASQLYQGSMPNQGPQVNLNTSNELGPGVGNVGIPGADQGLGANLVGGDKTGLFGLKDTTWGNIGTLGNLGMGALNTWAAMEQLNLAKDAFSFNKDMKDKEYGMAKDAYDRNVARAASIGEQMRRGAAS